MCVSPPAVHVEGKDEVIPYSLKFKDGAWQEQTGAGWGSDCEWFAEHIPEELDTAGEYMIVDGKLTLVPNSTTASWMQSVEVAQVEQLVSVKGSAVDRPVRHLAFRGLTFTQTTTNFMKKYLSPGVGDWSIYPSGAMVLDTAEHIAVENCTFTELGGNAVFMHGYNRWHNISRSEFVWLGDSAVALVGRSNLADATAGDMPQDNSITHNWMHEVGIITKQASPFFQTVAAATLVHGNVMHNGPRAGIVRSLSGREISSNGFEFRLFRRTSTTAAPVGILFRKTLSSTWSGRRTTSGC